ncbi:MAG: hypothetical protein WAL88_10210, partial [Nitrosotalea sp.]
LTLLHIPLMKSCRIVKYFNFQVCPKMRIDACRYCGYELQSLKTCLVCNKPYKFYCKSCRRESDDQVHDLCLGK